MTKNIFVRLMSMNEEAWQRHSNPVIVWSRILTGLPVLLGAVWTIKPLAWVSAPIIVTALLWLWINPRLFSPRDTTNNWASKVTFGERVWLNRSIIPIPKHHTHWAIFLSVIAGIGFLVAIIGAYHNMALATITGGLISWFGKMWFCDRMVWLDEDTEHLSEEYNNWLKPS
jgi:hypothetical protein